MNDRIHWFEIHDTDSIETPSLLVYADRIAANIRHMVNAVNDVEFLRPHVKTIKTPQIVSMMLDSGIQKFKSATIAETEMVLNAGADNVLLAYPLVGPNIQRFINLNLKWPAARIIGLVDNLQILNLIHNAVGLVNLDRPIELMLDLDVGMHRTGIEVGPEAIQIYQEMARMPKITPGGLHGYDGHIGNGSESESSRIAVSVRRQMLELSNTLSRLGLDVPRLVTSGTPGFQHHAPNDGFELGAGTAVLWDATQHAISPGSPFQTAAVVLTRVISKPGSNRICVDLGHKSIASEMPHPRFLLPQIGEFSAFIHSEEHFVMETKNANCLSVGDCLYAMPLHICPTVALHDKMHVVENRIVTDCWPVVARSRKLTV